mgnify:FL=1
MTLPLSMCQECFIRVVAAVTVITTKDFSTALLMDISQQFRAKLLLTTATIKFLAVVCLEEVLDEVFS